MKIFKEIHRRSLWQILGIYLAGGWVALQVVDHLAQNAGLPEWVPTLALIALIVGFPIVIATAAVQGGAPGRAAPIARPFADPEKPSAPEADRAAASAPDPGAPVPAADAPARAHHRLFTWRNATIGGATAVALVGLLSVGWMLSRSLGIGPAATLVAQGVIEESAVVLLTDFDSSDPGLSRMATEAFRVDLSQSQAIRLAEPGTVQAAIERMELDPAAPLDRDVGLQLAEREGIPAIVAGEINGAGGSYLLSASIVAPGGGQVLTSQRETARDSTDLIPAIDRLSKKLRERIGDSMRDIRQTPPLERVTTANLAALRKYSEASRIVDVEGPAERAVVLLEEAVALDTAFAAAWRGLGVQLRNRGQEPARMVEALSRAFEHQDRLTEAERYAARAMYFGNVTLEHEKAALELQRLLEMDPDDHTALNGLGVEYTEMRDFDRAAELFERTSRTNPDNWIGLYNVIEIRANLGRFDAARALLDTARARFGETAAVTWTEAQLAATMEEHARAEQLMLALRDRGPANLFGQALGGSDLATMAGAQGKIATAEAYLARGSEANRERGLGGEVIADAVQGAWLDVAVRGDPEAAIASVDAALEANSLEDLAPLDRPYLSLAQLYARAGDPDRAQSLVEEFEAVVPASLHRGSAPELDRARGEIALARGQYDEAIAAFERSDVGYCVICALPGLALAHEGAGNAEAAREIHERYATTRWFYRFFGDTYDQGPLQGPALERTAQLYDEQGDLENAALYYAKFIELWENADAELQPRVEAARERLQEIVEARG